MGELKIAKLVAAQIGAFSSQEIVAMATQQAANILQWDAILGSVVVGKRADITIVGGVGGDPYDHLIDASETDISLVVINGVPRFGTKELFDALGMTGESLKVGGATRRVFLTQDTQDPAVGKLSYSAASAQLTDALLRLKFLAKTLEKPSSIHALRAARRQELTQPVWRLVLDEIQPTGQALRARLPFGHSHVSGALAQMGAGAEPLSTIVEPINTDPLTVADDPAFVSRLRAQRNLPNWLKTAL